MCKRMPVLVLATLLLLLVLPATAAKADLQRILVITEPGDDQTATAAGQLLIRTALYAGWQCDFLAPDEVEDVSAYTDVIITVDPDAGLPKAVVDQLRVHASKVFVIGSGGLDKLTQTEWIEGTVAASWQLADGEQGSVLTSLSGIRLLAQRDEETDGKLYVGNGVYPLCARSGMITHLAYFDAQSAEGETYLINLLQSWLWPYENEPTAYSQFIVLDNVYPFSDPERLMELIDMFTANRVPFNICVMPLYTNADYPSVKRFCEVLSYAQSKGAGIILHVPLVSLQGQDLDDVKEKLAVAYEAYAMYGIYPVALELPESWALTEDGLSLAAGWRTILLYETDEQRLSLGGNTNPAYREGHQIIAPGYSTSTAFTSAYAQAVYLDINADPDELKAQVLRLKSSRRALASLQQQENVVYVGEHYIRTDGQGNLTADGTAVDLSYHPFVYEDYTYDRGFIQYMTSQIETSNRAILIFVGLACTFFVTAIVLSRRSIRKQLLHRRYTDPPDERGGGEE